MSRNVFLATSLCVLVATALVTDPTAAGKWECGERSNLVQEGKNFCAAGDFRQTETNLNKVFDALFDLHKTQFGDTSTLTRAQNAFETYRDYHCASQFKHIESEPYHPMLIAQCKTRLTNHRVEELTQMLQTD